MKQFAEWLATTPPSLFIQEHYEWALTTIQTVHITGIAIALGAVFLMVLRILGLSWTDQTMKQSVDRFNPALNRALVVLLLTGILMIIGEPVRELISFSFWVKMFLVVLGALIARAFTRKVRASGDAMVPSAGMKAAAVATLLIWIAIIFLGRLIAYDHVWGSWSPQTGGA